MVDLQDAVPVDELQRFLCGAGFPLSDILWCDSRLSTRRVSPAVFRLLRRHLFLTSPSREMPDDQWLSFVQLRDTIRMRRLSSIRRLGGVAVAIRSLPGFMQHPSLVRNVMCFLTPVGFSQQNQSVCRCLAPGCCIKVIGLEAFLDHLEAVHC